MVAKINNKLKITITKYQHELLLKHVEPYILDEVTKRAISAAISKNEKYHIYISDDDLEDLIGSVCFVANHEEKNKNLILELEDLIDNMECVLNDG